MKLSIKVTDPGKIEADAVVVFAWPGVKNDEVAFSNEAAKIDVRLGGLLQTAVRSEGFAAEAGKTLVIHSHGKISAQKIVIAGVGNVKELTVANLQKSAASAANASKAKRLAVVLSEKLAPQAVVEGVMLGNYQFTRHKTIEKEKQVKIEECVFLTTPNKLNAVTQAAALGESVSDGVVMARDLVNEPPSLTTPTYLADMAKSLAKGTITISCEVFGKSDLEKMGMGGLLAIARGSEEEPKFIKLVYKGGGRKTIALVGKGVTFDSGGLSLKPSDAMETMKMDMGGAATILGVFSVLAELRPKVNVIGLVAATENMPGARAVKPGDVVTIMNGKTVEVLNTDAEGRMVLADGLSYAVDKVKPDVVIDIATLTGACVVALGEEVAGLFTSDQNLGENLLTAAHEAGEAVWQMPLVSQYRELMKGDVADLKNIGGGKWGGAITGALFLQEFTDPAIPWAHLDIAGPAFSEKDSPLTPKGGTGFGVRMLINYLLTQ